MDRNLTKGEWKDVSISFFEDFEGKPNTEKSEISEYFLLTYLHYVKTKYKITNIS